MPLNIPLSGYISRKIKRLWNLPSLVAKLNLSLSMHESLGNQIIGLDTVSRKLLLVRKERDKFDYCVVDLQDIQHCSVKKVYGSIAAGELQTRGLNYYLESISLQLGFKSGAEPVAVKFFENRYNTRKQRSFLEAAAKKWEQFVSRMLVKPLTVDR